MARFVAVDGEGSRAGADAGGSRLQRPARQLLDAAAVRSAFEQIHVLGWMVLALVPARLALMPGGLNHVSTWLWAPATLAAGASMAAWPRRRLRNTPAGALVAVVAAVGCLAAAPAAIDAWLGSFASATSWVLLTGGFGVAVAATVAPSVAAASAAAAAPALAGLLALPSGLAALAAGAWAGALAWAAAWRLRRRWRRQLVASLEQDARLRAGQVERDAALRADSDKSRFLAIASHDLRQPVHALGLFAATLHKRLLASPEEPLARNLMRSVDGLERSFNAMLDISRLDGGALTPRLQTFSLRDIFRRLHMQYAGQAELAGLGLRFAPGGRSVTSDPQLLERIVGNLVHNAIRYTTRGGIVVVARGTERHVNIEVWDSGSGIAAGDLPRIFDEFYQVGRGERDRSQGLGMGLAIVKRLADLLGHRLEVASAPGRGTLFRLGVQRGSLEGFSEETAAADTLPMSVDVAQMVLVVDDEEPIREGLRLLLQEWGYQCMTAADAEEAERAVNALEGHVDLVLSDLHLGPGAGGREAVAAVRRLCGREVPAILVTGDTAGEALREVVAGTDPVLFKPVQPRHLFEAMRAALQ